MAKVSSCVVFAVLCFTVVNTQTGRRFYEEKSYHEAQELTDQNFLELAQLSNLQHFKSVLGNILIPRVVGTANHKKVGNYIRDQMQDLGWHVQEHMFTDTTPLGDLKFRNIIARLNPDADRFLVLACHYDSKYMREHAFVGATDSAVPCAMMINLAYVMSKYLEPRKTSNLSLMFIFFDGEEAFKRWSPTDSIYGARHLAKNWEGQLYKNGANQLARMDLMVLLDLLGAPDPVFYSFFQASEKWYVRLASAEQRLASLNQLTGYSIGKAEQTYFRLSTSNAAVEDDHLPFLRRSVNILHVIPSPFPEVWHTPRDDYNALDFNTIENLNKIFRVFVAEYLHTC